MIELSDDLKVMMEDLYGGDLKPPQVRVRKRGFWERFKAWFVGARSLWSALEFEHVPVVVDVNEVLSAIHDRYPDVKTPEELAELLRRDLADDG